MELNRILSELVFFLALVAISELCRQVAKRRCPGSSATQGLLVCTLVLLWYSVSITLILFNKWIMVHWQDDGLPFPIFYTMSHMFLKGVFSSSYIKCLRCKPLPRAKRKAIWGASFVGVMTGLDVAASNLSFLYISVSFFTMLKSASLIFILVLATSARIEKCSWATVGTISTITTGAFIMTYGEIAFDPVGFSLVMGSEVAASMRWIATQVLLQDKSLDAMGAVLYMSPASTLSLLPLTVAREHEQLLLLKDLRVAAQYTALVLFPGFLAFLLLLVEVQLVKETSSLTLSVFGNLKAIVTILLSIVVFKERTTPLQWIGLLVALMGMFAYSYVKQQQTAVTPLASLGYESLPEDDELDIENNGVEIKTVLDDLEDLSIDSPACTAMQLPKGQHWPVAPDTACVGKPHAETCQKAAEELSTAAPTSVAPPQPHGRDMAPEPEAVCVGKLHAEDAEGGEEDQSGAIGCGASPSSCSQSGADVQKPVSLRSPCEEVTSTGAYATPEESFATEADGAGSPGVAVNDSADTSSSPSLRNNRSGDEVEDAAITVEVVEGSTLAGTGDQTASPILGEDRSGDGVEGTSDNSGGSWVIEDGSSSPAFRGEAACATGELDAAAATYDEEENL